MNKNFALSGMSCASCAATIEKALQGMPHIASAQVNYASERLNVEYDETLSEVDVQVQLQKKLAPLGYSVSDQVSEADSENMGRLQKVELISSFVASLIVFVLAMTPWGMSLDHTLSGAVQFILITPIFFWVGRKFLAALLHFFKTGASTMNTLIGFGITSAYIYSVLVLFLGHIESQKLGLQYILYFESIGFIVSFVILGKYLEDKVKKRARRRLSELFSQGAKRALVKREDQFVEVNVQEVVIGDTLLLKPGAKVPVDAEVISGMSSLDESMLTGESIPVVKSVNDLVYAGTLNGEGALTLNALKVGGDTYLAQLMKYVDDAQAKKPQIGQLADKISSVFTPVVLVFSLIVFALWMLIPENPSWGVAIAHTAAVLVIACPCALGLATPTAIVVALSEGLGHGLLIRSAEVLEEGANIKAIVLDKTGTLTVGKPQVISHSIRYPEQREEILGSIAGLESYSEHPLSHALTSFVSLAQIQARDPAQFEVVTGQGVSGVVAGQNWLIGSKEMMAQHQIELGELSAGSGTLIFAARDGELVAHFELKDELRANMAQILTELKDQDVAIILASGDRQEAVSEIAAHLPLSEAYGKQSPLDKANLLEKLQRQYGHVAMVGDGMNDAPALVKANLSFAMGSGTEAAMQASDVTIVQNDLAKIALFFKLSQKTFRIIRENLFFSFIYNIIGIPLAAGAFAPWGITISPAFAGLAMGLSSISVVANSLRIKRI